MATTKIRSSSITDGQVAIADIVGGGAASAGTFLKQDGTWAAAGAAEDIFWENAQSVTTDYTITASKNAVSAGPVTVDSGVEVTVPSGATWVVV
jgi:hypothetical protein